MARQKKEQAAGKWRVFVRCQLYVEGPSTGVTIAGARLLKGDTDKVPCPQEVKFASDSPAEAEKERERLERYLNSPGYQ